MTEFSPNLVLFGDRAGLGRWLIGHYRQHLNYTSALAAKTPPIYIADHPIMDIGDTPAERRIWLDDHEAVHAILRGYLNVTGGDLSQLDFTKEAGWYLWLEAHANEHALFDQALGL
jgi:hypothetical protein